MSDDLTKRLRHADSVSFVDITDDLSVICSEDYALAEEAADTIDALRDRVKVLEGALGRCLNFIENTESEVGVTLESGDFARAALKDAEA